MLVLMYSYFYLQVYYIWCDERNKRVSWESCWLEKYGTRLTSTDEVCVRESCSKLQHIRKLFTFIITSSLSNLPVPQVKPATTRLLLEKTDVCWVLKRWCTLNYTLVYQVNILKLGIPFYLQQFLFNVNFWLFCNKFAYFTRKLYKWDFLLSWAIN